MRSLIIAVVVIAAIGGGYYWYTQSQTDNMQGTDNSAMQQDNSAMPAAAGVASGDSDTSANPSGTPEASGSTGTAGNATADTSATKEFSVTNSGFIFSPKTITVKKGDHVKITYTNGGGTHNFIIDGYGVGTKIIKTGESDSIEFTADKTGTFESFCSVGNHRAMGMVGKFIVTE